MSVTKTITLTNKGNAAGPYYEVSCSNDCSTYGPCITPGPLYLPEIGSSVNVDIYDTTSCIKLVNYNDDCNNSEIQTFLASGSTTTTTTTSTTTTSTTTTTAAPIYRFYDVNIESGSNIGSGNTLGYTDQFGNARTLSLASFGNRFYMYGQSGSFLYNGSSISSTYITDLGTSTTSTLSYNIYAGSSGTRLLNYQATNGEVVQNSSSNPEDYYVCAISGAIRQGWPQVILPYTITQTGTACGTTTTTAAPAATLNWSFTESGGTVGNMDLYINESVVESRSNTSSGTITVYVGDDIRVEVYASGCTGTSGKANAYTSGIIADASCNDGSTTLATGTYTVQTEDIGDTLSLATFARCDTGCI